jgi:hypothetical protein
MNEQATKATGPACAVHDCSVCPKRARLAAFVERFAMISTWDADAEENDPVSGGRYALAMFLRRADESGPIQNGEIFDVALYDTLGAALAGAEANVEEGWLPEQILDTETGDVYRPGFEVSCTASVDPEYRVDATHRPEVTPCR